MVDRNKLVNSSGTHIQLGRQLGKGGEGTVFDAPSLAADMVVKIYHDPLRPTKQEKLRAMVQLKTRELTEISTWPLDTIHDGQNKSIVGFVMPKMTGYKEIHKLYGPTHRRQEFASADWAFLILAARNTAAALATFHKAGHIVGDINPNNVVVSQSAKVKLIDCDSFQVANGNRRFLCEVGVPHFTPPELHGRPFDSVERTTSHDAFGLALLCFHLLFMGRHPYAGKYRNGMADMPIEQAIREYRFAYSSSAVAKQMSPPPNTLTLSIVSDELQRMFELAFNEQNAQGRRPPSTQWISALDIFRQNLTECRVNAAHKYYRALGACPWCGLEARSGVLFFVQVLGSNRARNFDLDRIWNAILAIVAPSQAALPSSTSSVLPHPFVLPSSIINPNEQINVYRVEKSKRDAIFIAAKRRWNEFQNIWQQHSADRRFDTKLAELRKCRDSYAAFQQQYTLEHKRLMEQARDLQKREYLERYFIDKAKITGIGQTRTATLASYGIETAADVTQSRIQAVPGFGPTLTYELLNWRASLERNFIFDPNKTTQLTELIQLQNRYSQRLLPLEHALRTGVAELETIKKDVEERRRTLVVQAEQLRRDLEQAEADVKLVDTALSELRRRRFADWVRMIISRPVVRYGAALLLILILAIPFRQLITDFILDAAMIVETSISNEGGVSAVATFTPTLSLVPPTATASHTFQTLQAEFSRTPSQAESQATAVPQASLQTITPISPPEQVNSQDSDTLARQVGSLNAVTNLNAWVYSDADTSSTPTAVRKGTSLEIIERNRSNVWCRVQTKYDVLKGWVYCFLLDIEGDLNALPATE